MSFKRSDKSQLNILSMAQIAVCTALLCISAFITVPVPVIPIPFTLQVVAVLLSALILKPYQAVTAQMLYTLLGIAGLPVFSGGQGGIGVLLSPTGGFIIGFIFASLIISIFKGKRNNIFRYILVTVFIGIPVIYFFGITFFMLYAGTDFLSAFASVASIFIAADVAKCIVASVIAITLKKALQRADIGFE